MQHQVRTHPPGCQDGQQAKRQGHNDPQEQAHPKRLRINGERQGLRDKTLAHASQDKHQRDAQTQAQQAAHNAQEDGFHQEHQNNLSPLHANGLEHRNFQCAPADRYQHGIGYADAADQERNQSHHRHQAGQGLAELLVGAAQVIDRGSHQAWKVGLKGLFDRTGIQARLKLDIK